MTMLENADVGVWQDLFTSIIEDADSNILLLDDEFRIINLNPGFYWIFLETYGIELNSLLRFSNRWRLLIANLPSNGRSVALWHSVAHRLR